MGDAHGAFVVDLHRDLGAVLAQRIVRQFGQVDHRVEASEIGRLDGAQILVERAGAEAGGERVVVQAAVAIEADVEAGDFMARGFEPGSEAGADVALGAGDENFHVDSSVNGSGGQAQNTVTSGIGTTNCPPHSRM